MSANDSAFPSAGQPFTIDGTKWTPTVPGLTKRELFVALMAHGIVSNANIDWNLMNEDRAAIANCAAGIANAVFAELEKAK